MSKHGLHQKVGSGNLRSQADKDAESKAALSKSGPGLKSKAVKGTRAYEKAEMASYKLNKSHKF